MSTFTCPSGEKHPLRFEFNGRGRKAYCTVCKKYYLLYAQKDRKTVGGA